MTNKQRFDEIIKRYEEIKFNLTDILRDIYTSGSSAQVFFDSETCLFSSCPDDTTNYKEDIEGEEMRADVFTVMPPEFISILCNGDFFIEDYHGCKGLAPFNLEKIKADKEKQEREQQQDLSWYEFLLHSHQDFFQAIEELDHEDWIEGEVEDLLESEGHWIDEKFKNYLQEYFAIN